MPDGTVVGTAAQRRSWHTLPTAEVIALLETRASGLSEPEASERRLRYGPNEVEAARRISPWEIFLEQFKSILILILLFAVVLSVAFGHTIEAIAITVILLFATLLGFAQEYRAERAIDALRQLAAPTASVLRDGRALDIPARDLVPGDVIVLRAGDKIPADARLLDAVNLRTEESALTGESQPVSKQTAPLSGSDLAVADRINMIYAGTAASYGRGTAVVVATGMATEFGKVAELLGTIETGKTPLQQNLDRLGHVLAQFAFGVVAVIVVLGIARGQAFVDMVIFGIALAVAVVPEALPAVVTISLAIGVRKMLKRHALIRRLPAVETLGSVSVICSDKTGTLTKDEMTVRKIFVADQMWTVSGSGYEPRGEFLRDGSPTPPSPALTALLQAAVLACDAELIRGDGGAQAPAEAWRITGDPTEGALVVAAAKAGLGKADLDARFPRTREVPFTSETKRMTTVHTTPEGLVAYSKGAPEVVLAACSRRLTERGEAALDAGATEAILGIARRTAAEALRVLAVAAKVGTTAEDAERDMTFLGLVGMIDPPRPEAAQAIVTCERAGIRPLMITGDHPSTAEAVARELGLLPGGRVVTGAELGAMSDADLEREVEGIAVCARVAPEHKLRVVSALQKRGQFVAMTGDGVNDAPALKKADIGIAMGITGTDVTKEAAAMTLTDDNFASIVAAVEEGRGVFANIKKYLMYLLSSNIGEMGLMAAAPLAGLPLPLTAVQILYVNLATDGLPALALAVDPPDKDLMHHPPRDPRRGLFTRPVVTLMLLGGVWSAAVNLGLFAWALASGRSQTEAMTMTFVSLVLIQFLKAYNYRSDRYSVLDRPFANTWLNLAITWELFLLALIIYVPWLNEPFGTFRLPLLDWLIVAGLAATIAPVLEVAKWMERRGWFGELD